ncbi:hypothetical protein HYW66_02275 [Candidatus Microgenomates bacterium]|nr:hypothetical protein [Candidatus Microgenomates bacterium]
MKERVIIPHSPIGGGHETYGLVVAAELQRRGVETRWVSPDTELSRLYWGIARTLYIMGGGGERRIGFYDWLRQKDNGNNPLLRLGQHQLRQTLVDFEGAVVASHAHTAVKPPRGQLVLLQGDVHGGKDYASKAADIITVPIDASRAELTGFGIPPEKLAQVGFFVPPEIKNEEIIERRLEQLHSGRVHLGIFFTGALPSPHLKMVRETLLPNLAPLIKSGDIQVTIYTFTDRQVAQSFLKLGKKHGLSVACQNKNILSGNWDLRVIYGETTKDAIENSLKAVGDLNNPISILLTMIGERLGWAAGVALVPLSVVNQTNVGGNTRWGVEKGLFLPPQATIAVPEMVRGHSSSFARQIMTGRKLLNPNGAENTAAIVQDLLNRA